MDMKILQVLDRLIPYDAFLNDLAARIVGMIKADSSDPEFVSQRKAYELFGRRNVERWKRQGKVESYKRPGKVEYRTSDLRLLQRTVQDYIEPPSREDDKDNNKTKNRQTYLWLYIQNISIIGIESITISQANNKAITNEGIETNMRPRWRLFSQTHVCGIGCKLQDTPQIQGKRLYQAA